MEFVQIYDQGVSQYSYIIGCDKTRKAIVVDPQRCIDNYIQIAEDKGLEIIAVAETHIHADFLSGVSEFIRRTGVKAYLSSHGKSEGWDYRWALGEEHVEFIKDGDQIQIGEIKLRVVATPGHTPEHIVFLVFEGDAPLPLGALTGDFVFAGDLGRPDLLERAAKQDGKMKEGAEALFKTVNKFLDQPDSLIVWPGHGAGSACGKSLGNIPYSSWGYEKSTSPALQFSEKNEFIDYITTSQKEPPLYFARMKHFNNHGNKSLDKKRDYNSLTAIELSYLLNKEKALLIIDTREDRAKAMGAHIKGSFYAPFASLSTAVGSMIEDYELPLLLVIEEGRSEEARRRLLNIGYDNILGFVTPKTLDVFFDKYSEKSQIPVTDFDAINPQLKIGNLTVFDVRSCPEYEAGHIKNAIHAPYTRLPEFVDHIPKSNNQIFVHCGSGQRASIAASYLKAQGFEVVLVNDSFSNAYTEN